VKAFLLVCLGGGAGSGARYLATLGLQRALGPDLPWGTFAVNVLGSFALGFLLTAAPHSGRLSPDLQLCLGAGLLGGFTTYSTFNFDTLRLLDEGRVATAIGYAALTLTVCLVAGFMGIAAAKSLRTA
jgi:CrcB protein